MVLITMYGIGKIFLITIIVKYFQHYTILQEILYI